MNTQTEFKMFGCTVDELKSSVEESITFKTSGAAMIAMGMMSDAQEEMYFGDTEAARKTLNRAKFVLSEYCMKE